MRYVRVILAVDDTKDYGFTFDERLDIFIEEDPGIADAYKDVFPTREAALAAPIPPASLDRRVT